MCLSHRYSPPNHRALSRFMAKQVGTNALLLFVEGQTTSCKVLYLLPTTVKEWDRDTVAKNMLRLRHPWLYLDGR